MASTGLDTFDKTLHLTNTWIGEIARRIGGDRQHGYHALRAVLHALRDRLLPGEAADLAAELPMLVRGIYFEGYKPDRAPSRARTREAFLAEVHAHYTLDPNTDVEPMTRAVFEVIAQHVSSGETAQIKHMLPAEIAALWPGGGVV